MTLHKLACVQVYQLSKTMQYYCSRRVITVLGLCSVRFRAKLLLRALVTAPEGTERGTSAELQDVNTRKLRMKRAKDIQLPKCRPQAYKTMPGSFNNLKTQASKDYRKLHVKVCGYQ